MPRFQKRGKLAWADVEGHTSVRRTDPQEDITTKEESFDCSALGLSIICMGTVEGNLVEMLVDNGSVYFFSEELWTTICTGTKKTHGQRYAAGCSNTSPMDLNLGKCNQSIVSAKGEPN